MDVQLARHESCFSHFHAIPEATVSEKPDGMENDHENLSK